MPARFWSHPCCSGTAICRRVAECGDCGDKGGFWLVSDKELAGARYAVLREYPSAEARRDGFLLRAGALRRA